MTTPGPEIPPNAPTSEKRPNPPTPETPDPAPDTEKPTANAKQRLQRELHRESRRWRLGTLNYGVTYYVSRIVLIVASAIVAANQNLSGSAGAWLVHWTPVLSLLVAIITALDTWLKPLQKWRGFMESRDKLADIAITFEQDGDLAAARTQLSNLRDYHRRTNIF